MIKIILVVLILLLGVAYFTRPDDKKCIIGGARAVWGKLVPDEGATAFFEEFMDRSSEDFVVKDRLLFKEIQYRVRDKETTVAIGAFGHVFALVKPYQTNDYIPAPPAAKQ